MSTLSWIVVGGFIAIVYCLDAIQKDIRKNRSSYSGGEAEQILEKLQSIETHLDQIEKHTARVAEPLHDQDAIDRKYLVGKYDPDRMIDELDTST